MTWMIYGANGYTGQMMAAEAARRGLQPVLAGRNAATLAPLGEKLGLPVRALSRDDPGTVESALSGMAVVLRVSDA